MSGHTLTPEEYKSGKKAVWVTTALLTFITLLEVGIALVWPWQEGNGRLVLNLLLVMMGLLKAYWIMGEFMHLSYERRSLTMSILLPVLLLVWFVIALLSDGNFWMNIRASWGGM
jgi:cytochrome c oxidase subunit IV